MVLEEREEDVESFLKLRMILAEYAQDDPFVQACMLVKLTEAYDENDMKIPRPISDFVRDEASRICAFLKKSIEHKKSVRAKLVQKRNELVQKQISPVAEKKEDPEKRLTRNEEIWGQSDEEKEA